jgi:hypothetical protein
MKIKEALKRQLRNRATLQDISHAKEREILDAERQDAYKQRVLESDSYTYDKKLARDAKKKNDSDIALQDYLAKHPEQLDKLIEAELRKDDRKTQRIPKITAPAPAQARAPATQPFTPLGPRWQVNKSTASKTANTAQVARMAELLDKSDSTPLQLFQTTPAQTPFTSGRTSNPGQSTPFVATPGGPGPSSFQAFATLPERPQLESLDEYGTEIQKIRNDPILNNDQKQYFLKQLNDTGLSFGALLKREEERASVEMQESIRNAEAAAKIPVSITAKEKPVVIAVKKSEDDDTAPTRVNELPRHLKPVYDEIRKELSATSILSPDGVRKEALAQTWAMRNNIPSAVKETEPPLSESRVSKASKGKKGKR